MTDSRLDIVTFCRSRPFLLNCSFFLRLLDLSIEMHSRSDEINMSLNFFWDAVVLACNVWLACFGVSVLVVLGLKERFSFRDSNIGVDPVEALGFLDTVASDAGFFEPLENGCHCFLGRSKSFRNLLCGPLVTRRSANAHYLKDVSKIWALEAVFKACPRITASEKVPESRFSPFTHMLAKVGRIRVRDIHQKLFSSVEVTLRERNSHRQNSVSMNCRILPPKAGSSFSALMNDMSLGVRCRSSSCSGQETTDSND